VIGCKLPTMFLACYLILYLSQYLGTRFFWYTK